MAYVFHCEIDRRRLPTLREPTLKQYLPGITDSESLKRSRFLPIGRYVFPDLTWVLDGSHYITANTISRKTFRGWIWKAFQYLHKLEDAIPTALPIAELLERAWRECRSAGRSRQQFLHCFACLGELSSPSFLGGARSRFRHEMRQWLLRRRDPVCEMYALPAILQFVDSCVHETVQGRRTVEAVVESLDDGQFRLLARTRGRIPLALADYISERLVQHLSRITDGYPDGLDRLRARRRGGGGGGRR